MEYVEKWGNTEEEAIELALVDLKLSREDVVVEVLEESNKGFLGIGKKLAKVRVSRKDDSQKVAKNVNKEAKAQENIQKTNDSAAGNITAAAENITKKEEEKPEVKKEEVATPVFKSVDKKEGSSTENVPGLDFLTDMIEKMGLDVEISASKSENGSVHIDIEGNDAAAVIGKHGQTLDAIQYLTRVVVNREDENYTKIVVDAAQYRAKREETLIKLAKRLASKVAKTGKAVKLEPMSPYERKIIHTALQNSKKVVTRSEGKEPYRRVVIQID